MEHIGRYGRQLRPVLSFDRDRFDRNREVPDWHTIFRELAQEKNVVPEDPLIFGSPFPVTGYPAVGAHESYLKAIVHSKMPAFYYEPTVKPERYSHEVETYISRVESSLTFLASGSEHVNMQRALQLDMRRVGATMVRHSVAAWEKIGQIGMGLQQVYNRHPNLSSQRRVRVLMQLTEQDLLLPAILRSAGIPKENFSIRPTIGRRLPSLSHEIVDTSRISVAHYKALARDTIGPYTHYTALLAEGKG